MQCVNVPMFTHQKIITSCTTRYFVLICVNLFGKIVLAGIQFFKGFPFGKESVY